MSDSSNSGTDGGSSRNGSDRTAASAGGASGDGGTRGDRSGGAANGAAASGGSESSDERRLDRRTVLGLLAGGTGAAAGAWLLAGDDGPGGDGAAGDTGPTYDDWTDTRPGDAALQNPNDDVFDVWAEVGAALRTSPDHLPGTAAALAEEGDPAAIFEFVRDEIVTQPPGVGSNHRFDWGQKVNGGARAALRSGVGTGREKTELLAAIYRDAGYEAEVVTYNWGLSRDFFREEYTRFGAVDHEFAPEVDPADRERWRETLGVDASDVPDVEGFDPDAEDSRALADRLADVVDFANRDGGMGFDWRGPSDVPIVRFRDPEADDVQEASASGTSGTGDVGYRYADLFHGEELWDDVDESNVWEAGATNAHDLHVTVEGIPRDATGERIELVSGSWRTDELAGRQLVLSFMPGVTPFDHPQTRFRDVTRFVPGLGVQDPHADQERLEALSVVGSAFQRDGVQYDFEDDGSVTRDGRVVLEGEDEATDDTPDGGSNAATDVSDLSTHVDLGGYPEVKLGVQPVDGSGDLVGGLASGDFTVTEDDRAVAPVLQSTTDRPVITVLYDTSLSMEIHGFYEGDRQAFRDRLEETILDINPGVDVRFEGTNSDLWRHLSEASRGPADAIIYLTDGDTSTEYTDGEEQSIRQGPPVIMAVVHGGSFDVAERMAEFSGGTVIAANAEDEMRVAIREYVADLERQISDYTLAYRTPHEETRGETREVTVAIPAAEASDTVTYDVPGASLDMTERSGIVGLQLSVSTSVGDVPTVERSLAGWDPTLDADRSPDEEALREVHAALFGDYALSFESAGVPTSVKLDDHLAGKRSLRPMDEARHSGSQEEFEEKRTEGVGVVSEHAQLLQTPLPDRATDDSVTYGTGLRTVLYSQRPVFGTDRVVQSVDLLPTQRLRTLTPDGDRERELHRTLAATARLAVIERDGFDTSTAALLEDETLVPHDALGDEFPDEATTRFGRLRSVAGYESRSRSNVYLYPESGSPTAMWAVDAQTGQLTGILPDGSGGGESVKRIKRQLEEIQQLTEYWNDLLDARAARIPGSTSLGLVATYFGDILARLYAIASIGIATMDSDRMGQEAQSMLETYICNLAVDLAVGFAEPPDRIEDMLTDMAGKAIDSC